MSFKIKVVITNVVLMALSLGMVGYLLIHNSYQVSLDMQLESGMEEHQMLVSAVQSAIVDLMVKDSFTSMQQLGDIGADIAEPMQGMGTQFLMLDENRVCIYTNHDKLEYDEELLNYLEKGTRNYVIEEYEGKEYLTIASLIQARGSYLYLINQRDISNVYQENEKQITFFKIIMGITVVLCSLVIYLISRWLTRPIEQLNQVAAVITDGDYSVRTQIHSDDEIGELAGRFDQMAEAIEEHVEELRNQARQQEDFVASFTHEIKTPMTAIIGYSDMIRSKELTEEQRMLTANYIFHEGKRLEGMSLKLFDLIALNRNQIEKQDIYTQVFGEELLNAMQPVVELSEEALIVQMEPAVLQGDWDLLKTVFMNLIDNARKASGKDDCIYVTGALCRSCVKEQPVNESDIAEAITWYEFRVQDFGCGIPEGEVAKICEAFYMVDKSRARKQGGAGLGLSIASRIIEVHGGAMQIESELGKGTTVLIRLPAKEAAQDEE